MLFVLREEFNKLRKKVRCLTCRVSDLEDVIAQNGLTTSTTTTTTAATTTTTTTAAPTTTTTTTTP